MNREGIVQKWLDIARQDLEVAELTCQHGYWLYAAFLCHQSIEKTLKAYYCATHDDDPRYTHSHGRLIDDCGLADQLTEEHQRFIDLMVHMYISARYPEHKVEAGQMLNEESCKYVIEKTRELTQWIEQKL